MDSESEIELCITDLNPRDAADVWARINIIFAAFIDDGHTASINRTTYTPVTADQESDE